MIRRRKYLPQSETDVVLGLIDEIGRMLRSLSYEVRASTRTSKGDRYHLSPSTYHLSPIT